ncbi:Gfo/Idh/MocA family oxidoreductase [Burkholderia multivorans]|uniref:Gfo/Idh/MocA family protein n=1 Tax=Burkholderia multivorans TaxID=87883 RepID=UPI001C22F7D6|nr:Gfo/Idh/MocA family oxidoreductase [Burkholderia multivorans]MBU9205430.1 Gfo/Idh/MocA family oxidoreductase [Burkholderia multivorans]MCO8353439.1 Gfo/Idh/MocA family oxidoreductase [Burkholderia multivorans]MCO8385698.1 Gfo/Idh/MocA family oxidoreductase [Burkholderia multivorans]MCO8406621.1 Gfo/Idh/MocA family oxidoreductase [Burkholderia multivorans]MCO8434794.1 Gfo/Idh/MocA family oxidoreductase [Burkholderia multivorans]
MAIESVPARRETGVLRAVIIGAGMIGEVHRRAASLAGAEIVGVMASNPSRSIEAASRWHTAAVTSLDGLRQLAPDVVHVCSPNGLHADHVRAAFEAGAHVICEKPLAIGSDVARELAELAQRHERVATVPFVYRFHPLVREIRARAQDGEFGRWHLLHGSYLQDWLLSPLATSWRVDSTQGGPSRTFADIGSHWCDLMEFVTGERISSLVAAVSTTIPERPARSASTFGKGPAIGPMVRVDTEDAATVIFRTRSGVMGSVIASQVSAGRKNRLWFEFDGERRSAVFDQEQPETVWLGGEASAEVLQRDPGHGSAEQRRLSHLPAGHAQGYAQCFENFVADTYSKIRGEAIEGVPGFDDGLRSAQIVEAVIDSARSGQWVDVAMA